MSAETDVRLLREERSARAHQMPRYKTWIRLRRRFRQASFAYVLLRDNTNVPLIPFS